MLANDAEASQGRKHARDLSLGIGSLIGSAYISFTIIPAACAVFARENSLKLERLPILRDDVFFLIELTNCSKQNRYLAFVTYIPINLGVVLTVPNKYCHKK